VKKKIGEHNESSFKKRGRGKTVRIGPEKLIKSLRGETVKCYSTPKERRGCKVREVEGFEVIGFVKGSASKGGVWCDIQWFGLKRRRSSKSQSNLIPHNIFEKGCLPRKKSLCQKVPAAKKNKRRRTAQRAMNSPSHKDSIF